jgi:hypothetical protein
VQPHRQQRPGFGSVTSRACEGYSLLCYAGAGGGPTLIDMEGHVVHAWQYSSRRTKNMVRGLGATGVLAT